MKAWRTLCLFALLAPATLSAQNPQQGWSFNPPVDFFDREAMLDLRYLNEEVAGENGFVRLSPDGEGFETENGGPIRFWAIGGGDNARTQTTAQLDQFARFLAKKGVNMIRTHARIHSVTNDINQANVNEVDAIWRLVASMKKEGIYTTISPFWPQFISQIPTSWDIGDYSGTTTRPWALLFFNQRFRDAYKNWVTYLYTETNPYTGIPLKDDPAVGLIQIQNEDGVFFWTIQGVQPSLMAEMESQFHDWLIEKYGTIAAAYAAWSNLAPLEADQPSQGRMGIYIIWEATQPQTGGKDRRVSDQIAFYTDVQTRAYQEIYDHLRAIGCQQLINTSNWKTADAARLLDAERLTNTVGEVMAVNRYYDSDHIGENNGWRIDPGHQYRGESVLFNPHQLPLNVKQVKGKPFVMSESSWPFPHKYLAESNFVTAAYAALSGFDTYYWFSPAWIPEHMDWQGHYNNPLFPFQTLANNQRPLLKFNIMSPGHLASFPGNALMFRLGMVQEGSVVVDEKRSFQDIFDRKIPLITEESGFDPNRDSYDNQQGSTATEVPPIAYLAGKVRVSYEEDPGASFISPELTQLLDFPNRKVTSTTNQLAWDYGKGQFRLNAPAAQGAAGFFQAGEVVALGDITFTVNNEYAALQAVSMDGTPLATAEKILLQIGTRYELTGYRESPSTFTVGGRTVNGFRVDANGTVPWRAANTQVSVQLRNDRIRSAHLVDANGYRVNEIPIDRGNNQVTLSLPSNAMYVIFSTEEATITSLPGSPAFMEAVQVFPNPFAGSFTVSLPENMPISKVQLLDLQGREVFQQTMDSREAQSTITLTPGINPGMYILRLYQGSKLVGHKKLLASY